MAKSNKSKKRRLRWIVVGAVVAAALLLGWCGRGWFGGGGSGDEATSKDEGQARPIMAATVDAGKAPRCRLRVDEAGLTMNGEAATVEAAVEACRASAEAELVTTGLAKYGTVEALDAALSAAKIRVYRVGAKQEP